MVFVLSYVLPSCVSGEYAGTQGLGLLRLHSTYRHDLKIYASDEGRVQVAFALISMHFCASSIIAFLVVNKKTVSLHIAIDSLLSSSI